MSTVGGGGEIRTHETLSSLTVFKTVPFNRSGTPPMKGIVAEIPSTHNERA